MVWLGLQDSTWSLVVIYPTITLPVSIWLLIGFLKALPKDLEEQAMVDGYSRAGAFVHAVVPLLFPGMVAVVVFAFTVTAAPLAQDVLVSVIARAEEAFTVRGFWADAEAAWSAEPR